MMVPTLRLDVAIIGGDVFTLQANANAALRETSMTGSSRDVGRLDTGQGWAENKVLYHYVVQHLPDCESEFVDADQSKRLHPSFGGIGCDARVSIGLRRGQ